MFFAWFVGCTKTCGEHLPEEVFDAQASFLDHTGGSLDEAVRVGDAVDDLSSALFDLLHDYYYDGKVKVPRGFTWDGTGTYVAMDGGDPTRVQFLFGDDFEVGAAGTQVVPDLFDPDNYLVGVEVSFELPQWDVLIDYTATGPLVELLGQGPNPPNPMRMSIAEAENPYRIGRLQVQVEAELHKATENTDATYRLTGGPEGLKHLIRGVAQLRLHVDGLTAGAGDGAELTSEGGELTYTIGPDGGAIPDLFGVVTKGTLEGAVPFELRGGELDVDGAYGFEASSHARTSWWCAAP